MQWGLIALFVGLFAFGIFMGPLAVKLGDKWVENGASIFGRIVKVAGWLEVALSIPSVLALAGA